MRKYRCTYCEYIYDPVLGDPEHNVGRNTPFDALPDDWVCPVCGKPAKYMVIFGIAY